MLEKLDRALDCDVFDLSLLEKCPVRRYIKVDFDTPVDYQPYSDNDVYYDDWEHGLIRIRKKFFEMGYPLSLFRQPGTFIFRECFENESFLFDSCIFPLRKNENVSPPVEYEKGMYASVYGKWLGIETGSPKVYRLLKEMRAYMLGLGLEADGPCICEMLAGGILAKPALDRDGLFRLSVKVRPASRT